jgi:hypothetical protein
MPWSLLFYPLSHWPGAASGDFLPPLVGPYADFPFVSVPVPHGPPPRPKRSPTSTDYTRENLLISSDGVVMLMSTFDSKGIWQHEGIGKRPQGSVPVLNCSLALLAAIVLCQDESQSQSTI